VTFRFSFARARRRQIGAALLGVAIGVAGLAACSDSVGGGSASGEIDATQLPLGDGKFLTSPRQGYVYSCITQFNGLGALRDGPWIDETAHTWDATHKISVLGSVAWPAQFAVKQMSLELELSGDGLPSNPTGVFPIARSDPAYAYDPNPNSIKSYTLDALLPANPSIADAPSCVGGTIGVSTLGVPFYSAFDALGRDAPAHEIQDACNGHPEITGQYHFHALPACWRSAPASESGLIGWALDGFGIYVELDSSGRMLATADLDECHGRVSEITWNGTRVSMYHYVATLDFPYLVGCYRGTPIASATGLHLGPPP